MITWQNPFIPENIGAPKKAIFRRVQPIQERGDIQPKLKSFVVKKCGTVHKRRHVEMNNAPLL